jgi:nicotinamidase-related amidase
MPAVILPDRAPSEQDSPLGTPPRELPEPHRALLLLSVQRAPLADPADGGMPHAPRVRRNIARVVQYARMAEPQPLIVHVRHRGDVGDADEFGAPGWQLWTEPRPGEHIVDKTKTSAFSGTSLRDVISPRAEVVIVGCASDSCVRTTCRDALERGNTVRLIL